MPSIVATIFIAPFCILEFSNVFSFTFSNLQSKMKIETAERKNEIVPLIYSLAYKNRIENNEMWRKNWKHVKNNSNESSQIKTV